MTKTVTLEIPEQWLQGLDPAAAWQEIVQLGIHQFKIRQALQLYQSGAGSLGYVAEQFGLTKRDLVREALARGIEPPFDERTFDEELGA